MEKDEWLKGEAKYIWSGNYVKHVNSEGLKQAAEVRQGVCSA